MDDVLIRRLKKEDADEIMNIEATIGPIPNQIDLKRIIEEEIELEGGASYVAEYRGRIVGYMMSHITSGNFGMDKSAWISVLGVSPKYMGMGIGMRLADTIFKHYQQLGITNVFTSVRWDSTDLLSFFKTLGFDRSNFINLRKILDS